MQMERVRDALEKAEEIQSEKAVRSRLSKANTVEAILGESLDAVTADDDRMYQALLCLKGHPKEHNGCLQNVLRWYYKTVNGRTFPQLSEYKKGC